MAHLWVEDRETIPAAPPGTRTIPNEWLVLPLTEEAYCLDLAPPRPIGQAHVPGNPCCLASAAPSRVDAGSDSPGALLECRGGGCAVLLSSRDPMGVGRGLLSTLVCPPARSVRVSGLPLATGVRVLRDRDEITIGGALPARRTLFYSSETLARIESFEGSDGPVRCARCKTEIHCGDPIVRCPSCGIAHHQLEEKPCWLSFPTCAMDQQATSFDTGYLWTPYAL